MAAAASAPVPGMSAISVTTGVEVNAERTSAAANVGWSEVTVAIHGDQRTFEARDTLKKVGLRWNPTAHAWWGNVPVETASKLIETGLPVLEFLPDEHGLVADPVAPIPALAAKPSPPERPSSPQRTRRTPKGPTLDPFGPREFDDRDIVANLPDDSREEQERTIRRFLRDLRLRVKGVRALMSADPSIVETLASNPEKARAFYAIHHVTRDQVEHGVPDMDVEGMEWADVREQLQAKSTMSWASEDAERLGAALPGSEEASA